MKPHAVYGYGVVSSSTLYSIRDTFPSPEGYAEIDSYRHMTGGEAANSSIIVAESYIRENYPDRDLQKLFRDYQAATNGLVISRFGDTPIWYARPDESVRHFQPYSIDPVDTTGGGRGYYLHQVSRRVECADV